MSKLLDLPTELLIKVFENLSYHHVGECRLTCKKFNDVGRYVMMLGMRKMAARLEMVVKAYIGKDHRNRKNNTLNIKRLALGAKSLLALEALIKNADAASFHLIKSGALPPFPGMLLDFIKYAVVLAMRRNPLIGEVRLKTIFRGLEASLTKGLINYSKKATNPFLPDKPALLSLIDLFDTLPLTREEIQQMDYGVQILYHLPKTVGRNEFCLRNDPKIPENITLLIWLVFINGLMNFQFINKTWQDNPNYLANVDRSLVLQVAFIKERKKKYSLKDLMDDNLDLLEFRVLLLTKGETENSYSQVMFFSSQSSELQQ